MAPKADGVIRRPEGATSAFLLIHGFAAAPDEVETLGKFLEEKDIASYAVRVAGHATSPEELARTSRYDWYESAERGLGLVESWKPDYLFVAGFSMGGLLSLLLCANESDIDGLVTICPAVSVSSRRAKLLPILKRIKKYREVNLENIAQDYDVPRTKYSREPLAAIHEFFRLAAETEKKLNRVSVPTLVLQAGEDKTINKESGMIVYDAVSSQHKALHVIPDAEHVIPCHPTRRIAYPLILEFVNEITKA